MRNQVFIIGIVLVSLFSCGPRIHATYDHKVNFTKYRSFCWMKGCEFNYDGPKYLADSAVRGHFKKAIIDAMAAKGIVYEADYPQLLVDVHITIENKSEVVYHRSQEGQMTMLPLADPEVVEFLKGTLVIDIADRSESRMIWRSVAEGYMDLHPELSEKNIRKGIFKVMRDFPPPPISH